MVGKRLILFLLISMLAACGGSEPPTLAPEPAAHGQLENWRGGSAVIETYFHAPSGAARVATGTVNEAGNLEFALLPVKATQLTAFSTCPNVEVSDTALHLNTFSSFDVIQGESLSGQLAQASSLSVLRQGLTRVGDYYVQYTYADRAAQLEGSCAVGGVPGSFAYALELTRGWNLVTFKLVDQGVLELSTAAMPASATWFYSEARP